MSRLHCWPVSVPWAMFFACTGLEQGINRLQHWYVAKGRMHEYICIMLHGRGSLPRRSFRQQKFTKAPVLEAMDPALIWQAEKH